MDNPAQEPDQYNKYLLQGLRDLERYRWIRMEDDDVYFENLGRWQCGLNRNRNYTEEFLNDLEKYLTNKIKNVAWTWTLEWDSAFYCFEMTNIDNQKFYRSNNRHPVYSIVEAVVAMLQFENKQILH